MTIKKRLEEIRKSIKNECVSYSEIAELQSLSKYIDKNDIQLLEWAGVKEKNHFDSALRCTKKGCNNLQIGGCEFCDKHSI